MRRFLITGIAGFIGSHLALALKKRGDWVCGCDNFNLYYSPALKKKRTSLLHEEGISVYTQDITDESALKALLEQEKITHIVHLAAQAGVRYCLTNPSAYTESNLKGFVSILEAVRAFPSIKLTYASSSSVYGLNTKVPFAETDPVNQPASFYAATKRSNELIAHSYYQMHGIRSTALRFFTVYGPWGRPDMAYYSFTDAILAKKPLTVFGKGLLKRDFTYIDDIIDGTIRAIEFEGGCEIFNLGNNDPVSTLDLITILEELLGVKASLQFADTPPGDVPITYADITKSQALLGFSPKVPLEEGLKHFVKWYLTNSH